MVKRTDFAWDYLSEIQKAQLISRYPELADDGEERRVDYLINATRLDRV